MSTDNVTLLADLRRESCLTPRAARACIRVLATLKESEDLLQQLLDDGELIEGGCAEAALDLLGLTIGMLEPSDPEPDDKVPSTQRPALRIVPRE